jgi:hypothetical protein
MRRAQSIFSFLVFAISCFSSAVPYAAATEPELTAAEVLDRVRQSLFAFSSIEFRYQWQYVGVRAGEASNQAVYGNAGEFAYADGKFFSDYYITVGKETSHGYSAFDGELYQSISPNSNRLGVSSGLRVHTPYAAILPIMKPCAAFLGYEDHEGGLRFDIDSHRTPAMWHAVQTTASLDKPEAVRNHPCTVVTFTQGPERFLSHFKLYAAIDLGFYPIRVIRQAGEASKNRTVIINVTELADRKTANSRPLVPLRMETITEDAIGTRLGTEIATIDAESLKIDQPIASDRLYLKRLMPENIIFAANVTAQQQARYEQGPK